MRTTLLQNLLTKHMLTCLLINAANEIKESGMDAERHVLCGHKTNKNFGCMEEWMHEIDDQIIVIQLWAKSVGSKKNKNESFANYTHEIVYGSGLLAAIDAKGDDISMTIACWMQFIDCKALDNDEVDDLDYEEKCDDELSDIEKAHDSDDEEVAASDEEEDAYASMITVVDHMLTKEPYEPYDDEAV